MLNKAIPAVEYLMSKDGGLVKRWVLEGTDYVYPRTSNKIIRAFLKSKGVADDDIMENYTPFGFADWQTEVAAIKKFGGAGKRTAVISTVNGDANVPFYKELSNQGVKAKDIPVIAFSVGEEELAGIDTKPLVGHLAGWSYFQSVNTPENKEFIAKWRSYTKNPKRVTNDPMESAYILFHMWVQAVEQAGTAEVNAVRQAMIGQKVKSPSGVEVVMQSNHHMAKPVMIGEVQADGQFASCTRASRCHRRRGALMWRPTKARSRIGRTLGCAAAAPARNIIDRRHGVPPVGGTAPDAMARQVSKLTPRPPEPSQIHAGSTCSAITQVPSCAGERRRSVLACSSARLDEKSVDAVPAVPLHFCRPDRCMQTERPRTQHGGVGRPFGLRAQP